MDDWTEADQLDLQADQYARKAVPPSPRDREHSLLSRNQVRALIRDAFKEGRLTAPAPAPVVEPKPFSPWSERMYDQYLIEGAPGSYDDWLRAKLFGRA